MSTAISAGIVVVKALGVALTFLATNPVGLVITAIGLLALALYEVWKNWDSIKGNLVALWAQLKTDLSGIAEGLKEYIFGVFTSISAFVTEKIDYLKNKATEAANYLRNILSSYNQSGI
jgi:phage-related protein